MMGIAKIIRMNGCNWNSNCDFKKEIMKYISFKDKKDFEKKWYGYLSRDIFKRARTHSTAQQRIALIEEIRKLLNGNLEYIYLNGNENILITAPHATYHFRETNKKKKDKFSNY